jgi:D-cysteine desulfhydrase family pyridoxal phosphate-dependent enzyme
MSDQNSLQQKLDHYPRIPLAEYPTPLDYLPRLSAEVGREVYIKRDDSIGPGMGGNKTRKLEYLLAEARRRGARKVVTFGGLQSNHARITAAAACKLGMEPHLFYFDPRPEEMPGNLLLDQIFGAHMHFIAFGGGGGMTLEATSRLVRMVAWLQVGRHYFIPVGGHTWLGCLGYVRAALEIHQQALEIGIENAHLVVAAGTGGTLAGLLAGVRLLDSPLHPFGIDVGKLWRGFPASTARLATEICHRLGEKQSFRAEDVPLLEGVYSAPKYGTPSEECLKAIRRLARLEGILLDPVYTGKAFAGLLDLVSKAQLGQDEPIIFLHTGGLPALFAFEDQLLQDD